jgi:hypothetical protein
MSRPAYLCLGSTSALSGPAYDSPGRHIMCPGRNSRSWAGMQRLWPFLAGVSGSWANLSQFWPAPHPWLPSWASSLSWPAPPLPIPVSSSRAASVCGSPAGPAPCPGPFRSSLSRSVSAGPPASVAPRLGQLPAPARSAAPHPGPLHASPAGPAPRPGLLCAPACSALQPTPCSGLFRIQASSAPVPHPGWLRALLSPGRELGAASGRVRIGPLARPAQKTASALFQVSLCVVIS